jgi:acyl-CoA reductase-like NAD-dependent aldehyde dehydrogenase
MNIQPFLIDDRWIFAEVCNPFNGAVTSAVARPSAAHVEDASTGALNCFEQTREQTAFERSEILERVADGIARRASEFTGVLIAEAGKPRKAAEVEVARAQQTFRFGAREAAMSHSELIAMEASPAGAEPRGVPRYAIGEMTELRSMITRLD